MKLLLCVALCLLATAWTQLVEEIPKDETVIPSRTTDRSETEYPEKEVEESLTKQRIDINALAAAPSPIKPFLPLAYTSVTNVCQPLYSIIKVPNSIYYGGQWCWVLKPYWYNYIRRAECRNHAKPCDVPAQANYKHMCVHSNYKRFGIYLFCPRSGIVQYNYYVAQCCECYKYQVTIG